MPLGKLQISREASLAEERRHSVPQEAMPDQAASEQPSSAGAADQNTPEESRLSGACPLGLFTMHRLALPHSHLHVTIEECIHPVAV